MGVLVDTPQEHTDDGEVNTDEERVKEEGQAAAKYVGIETGDEAASET